MRSLPSVDLVEGDINQGLPTEPYDLYIFDGWLPPTLPQGDLMFVNPPDFERRCSPSARTAPRPATRACSATTRA